MKCGWSCFVQEGFFSSKTQCLVYLYPAGVFMFPKLPWFAPCKEAFGSLYNVTLPVELLGILGTYVRCLQLVLVYNVRRQIAVYESYRQKLFRVSCRESAILLQLCKTLIRPHPEYSVQAWASHFSKDSEYNESVQKQFIK